MLVLLAFPICILTIASLGALLLSDLRTAVLLLLFDSVPILLSAWIVTLL
jgi:hypothetical protein